MRRALVPLVALALVAPAHAATPLWVGTYANEFGTQSFVDSTHDGAVVAMVGGATLVSSKDYGTTWTPGSPLSAPPGGGSNQTRVALMSASTWMTENGSAVALTRDAGATWKALTIPPVTRGGFEYATEVSAHEDGVTGLVGWSGSLVRDGCPYALQYTPLFTTHDAGLHWRRTDLPMSGEVWSSSWLDSRHAVASVVELEWSDPVVSGNSCSSTGTWTQNSIWTTADGGTHWRRAMRTGEWYVDAAWSSPTSLVMLGESKGVGRSYVSGDGGRTWRKPVPVYANSLAFNGFPSIGFAGGKGWVSACLTGAYRTDNGGSEWSHEPSAMDGNVWGVGDLTVATSSRSVAATPQGLFTRYGDVGAAGPAVPSGRLATPVPVTTVIGGASRTLVMPRVGPPSVRLTVAS
jgi:hypothetical protein